MRWIKFLILVSCTILVATKSFAQTDPTNFDIAGIKLGMTPEQVEKILLTKYPNRFTEHSTKSEGYCADGLIAYRVQNQSTRTRQPVGNFKKCVWGITVVGADYFIKADFLEDLTTSIGAMRLTELSLQQYFRGAGKSAFASLKQQLLSKYGQPSSESPEVPDSYYSPVWGQQLKTAWISAKLEYHPYKGNEISLMLNLYSANDYKNNLTRLRDQYVESEVQKALPARVNPGF
jgi:hypothetical protein